MGVESRAAWGRDGGTDSHAADAGDSRAAVEAVAASVAVLAALIGAGPAAMICPARTAMIRPAPIRSYMLIRCGVWPMSVWTGSPRWPGWRPGPRR